MKKHSSKNIQKWIMLGFNTVLGAGLITMLLLYSLSYQKRLYNQNVKDINNLNCAATSVADHYFENMKQRIADLAQYIEFSRMSLKEATDYIYFANSSDQEQFQLIDSSYKGQVIAPGHRLDKNTVDYSNASYREIQAIIDKVKSVKSKDVLFLPEFTNSYNGIKSFGLYTQISVINDDGSITYMTLMSVSRSKSFIDDLQIESEYEDMSTVLMDRAGNYIISNNKFKSENFFKFLYVFNGLSLDEMNDIKAEVNELDIGESGSITYNDSNEKECVFAYALMKDSEWFCVSMVPVSTFHNLSMDYKYTVYMVGILLFLLFIDIIWLNSMNKRLRNSIIQEREANNAKSDFLSRMSHDIRTPMNAILGFSSIGERETKDINSKNYFERIVTSGTYLLGLINDILDMSRIESGRVEFHETISDTEEFNKEIMGLVTPLLLERNIKLILKNNIKEIRYVYCDKIRVQQIYLNLVSNAIKYSEPGSEIEWITNEIKREDGKIFFEVIIKDNGCGMSEEFLKKVFLPFEQEYNKYSTEKPSTGLGLAICYNLVNQLGGEITVESKLGVGSTFTVKLAHRLADGPEEDESTFKADKISLEGRTVLLAEDNKMNTELAVKLLSMRGMSVTCAANGEDALYMFSKSKEGFFDIVLMDMRMPVMDGIEATVELRKLNREDAKKIPIIAMTADAYDSDKDRCILAGMDAHLTKPVDSSILYETIEYWISHEHKLLVN